MLITEKKESIDEKDSVAQVLTQKSRTRLDMAFAQQRADFEFWMLSESPINFRFAGSTSQLKEFATIPLSATDSWVIDEIQEVLHETIHDKESCSARHVRGNFSVTQAFSVINYPRAQAYAAGECFVVLCKGCVGELVMGVDVVGRTACNQDSDAHAWFIELEQPECCV